jgi:pimeloyl-ACP methyl ester carboxylesterase
MKRLGTTRPFRTPAGGILPGSIAEIAYVRLGGLDQWVMIRGENVANPLLVLLHGGPGFPEARLFRHFNSPLEKNFTVVYWDQRGTNRSFDRRIPASSMTVEQFIADLDELVNAVSSRFGRRNVAIYGHSWGSALGVLYAARFPEKVAAYVGAGQMGSWPASEASSYAFVLAEAERRKNRRALRELRAIGAPPYTASAKMVQGKWLGFFLDVVAGCPCGNSSGFCSEVLKRRCSTCPESCEACSSPRRRCGLRCRRWTSRRRCWCCRCQCSSSLDVMIM